MLSESSNSYGFQVIFHWHYFKGIFLKNGYNFTNFHPDVTILNSNRENSCKKPSIQFHYDISRRSIFRAITGRQICFTIWTIFIQMWPFSIAIQTFMYRSCTYNFMMICQGIQFLEQLRGGKFFSTNLL